MSPIPINVAFEDALTEFLARRILVSIPASYATQTIYNRGGSGYLKATINGFNNGAKGTPFWVATDLDHYECAPALIGDWLISPKHHNLVISVAVREAEAWVLADREAFAMFIGIRLQLVPENVEALENPKEKLIELVKKCRKREIRTDICPRSDSTSKIGPNYNSRLGQFVMSTWDQDRARLNAPSLGRIIDRLTAFQPIWAPIAHEEN